MPPKPSPSDFILPDTHSDLLFTGLKGTSVFKMDKLATLDKSIFTSELGGVYPAVFEKLMEKLRVALDL